jgi:acyl-CoA thioester hydrolase
VSFRYSCPLRWGDMDAQAHLNNAAFLDYLQEARVHYLLSGPPEMADLLDNGVLVVSHQVEYLLPVAYASRVLDIELWVSSVGGSRFGIAYEVRDGERLAVRARTTAVPFDLADDRLRRLSASERDVLVAASRTTEPFLRLPPVPPEGGVRSRLVVRWSDLDSYGHVNNVKYFDYLQEARIQLFTDLLAWTGAAGSEIWVLVRQDLDYRRPLDFRPAPYEVRTVISAVGNRSITFGAEITDPDDGRVFASARSVMVSATPFPDEHRAALAAFRAPESRLAP